jgi:hypothetical protein
MASIIPKLKLFIFLSMISLLINISACCVAYISSEPVLTDFTQTSNENLDIIPENSNITATNFLVATGTSFIPFVDIISLAFLNLDFITSIFIGLILGLLGAIKLVLIASIIASYIPFVNV